MPESITLPAIVAELRAIHENGTFSSVLIPADVKRAIELSMSAVELLAEQSTGRDEALSAVGRDVAELRAAMVDQAAAVDPAELRNLRTELDELRTALDELRAALAKPVEPSPAG